MTGNPDDRPLPEWDIHAEHVAALEATVFADPEGVTVLELRDGRLRETAPRR